MQPQQDNGPGTSTVPDLPADWLRASAGDPADPPQAGCSFDTGPTGVWTARPWRSPEALLLQRVGAALTGLIGGIVAGLWLVYSASSTPAAAVTPRETALRVPPTPLYLPAPQAPPMIPLPPDTSATVSAAALVEPLPALEEQRSGPGRKSRGKRRRGVLPPPVLLGQQPQPRSRVVAVAPAGPPALPAWTPSEQNIRISLLPDGTPASPPKTANRE